MELRLISSTTLPWGKNEKWEKWPSKNICRRAAAFTRRNLFGLCGLCEEVILYCKESKQQPSKMTFEKRSEEFSESILPMRTVDADFSAVLPDNRRLKWERGTTRTSQLQTIWMNPPQPPRPTKRREDVIETYKVEPNYFSIKIINCILQTFSNEYKCVLIRFGHIIRQIVWQRICPPHASC